MDTHTPTIGGWRKQGKFHLDYNCHLICEPKPSYGEREAPTHSILVLLFMINVTHLICELFKQPL